MNRRGRFAIAVALAGRDLGHRLAKVNYRLGWWTYQASKRVANLLMLPERLAERRRLRAVQDREGGGHG